VKTPEHHYSATWYGRLWDAFNNAIAVDPAKMSFWAWAWDNEGTWNPPATSNYYNGYVMIRLAWPLGFYVHFRFKADRRTQFGFGHKTNGRFGLTFRPWQSNKSAAEGVHGPNFGHAAAWDRGPA